MATGVYSKALVPVSAAVSVTTSAARLKSSSSLSIKFTIVAPPSNTKTIYIGDSNVSAARGIPLTAGQVITFGETKAVGDLTVSYDLAEFYIIATAASQVASLITYPNYKDR